jgi:hypothetical protein
LLKGIDIQAWLVYLEGFSISIVLEASGAIWEWLIKQVIVNIFQSQVQQGLINIRNIFHKNILNHVQYKSRHLLPLRESENGWKTVIKTIPLKTERKWPTNKPNWCLNRHLIELWIIALFLVSITA